MPAPPPLSLPATVSTTGGRLPAGGSGRGDERRMISKAKRRTIEQLARSRHRARKRMTVVEGPRVIAEALRSPVEVAWTAIGEEYAGTPEGWEIASLGRDRGVTTVLAPDDEVAGVCATDSPRPALAVVKTPPLEPRPLFPGRYLVADGVQGPGNLGTLVRSAWAFGLDGVAIGQGTVDPWNPKAVRASAGGVFRVPLLGVPRGFPTGGESVSTAPPRLLYADPTGVPPIPAGVPADAPRDSWVLVVGNEVRGVSERYRRSGRAVAVPLAPGVDSLNVAVAGSILMHILSSSEPG